MKFIEHNPFGTYIPKFIDPGKLTIFKIFKYSSNELQTRDDKIVVEIKLRCFLFFSYLENIKVKNRLTPKKENVFLFSILLLFNSVKYLATHRCIRVNER